VLNKWGARRKHNAKAAKRPSSSFIKLKTISFLLSNLAAKAAAASHSFFQPAGVVRSPFVLIADGE
jgi:hypothetical protein